MKDEFPIEEQYLKEWSAVLEKCTLLELLDYINGLKQKDSILYDLFWLRIYDQTLFNRISDHKIALAKVLAQRSRVKALQEDRTRIVFTVAQCSDLSLDEANKICSSELGRFFKLFDNYNIGSQVKSWKELAQKATEIRNAYHNYDCLIVKEQVNDLIAFYKIFSVSELSKLKELIILGRDILNITTEPGTAISSRRDVSSLIEKIKHFYSLANRVKLDIDDLASNLNFEAINEFIAAVIHASSLKVYFIENNLALDDFVQVETILTDFLAQFNLLRHMGADELERVGKPLEPITN